MHDNLCFVSTSEMMACYFRTRSLLKGDLHLIFVIRYDSGLLQKIYMHFKVTIMRVINPHMAYVPSNTCNT